MAIHVVPQNADLDNLPGIKEGDYLIYPDREVWRVRTIDELHHLAAAGRFSIHVHIEYVGTVSDIQELAQKADGLLTAWREKYQVLSDDEAGDG